MGVKLYREYKIKFYLNARHYIFTDGRPGEIHPHTWEFVLNIKIGRADFTEFKVFEKGINDYLERYQNCIMNEAEPFDAIIPTLENMTDYFADKFFDIIHNIGGQLVKIEASETPTRSYILNLTGGGIEDRFANSVSEKTVSDVLDAVLDELMES